MPEAYCHICDEWRPAEEVCTHRTKLRWLLDRIKELEQSETMQAARIAELEARLVEAREHAKRGCEHYCNWYGRGFSSEASEKAYDLYGYLRMILAAVVD